MAWNQPPMSIPSPRNPVELPLAGRKLHGVNVLSEQVPASMRLISAWTCGRADHAALRPAFTDYESVPAWV